MDCRLDGVMLGGNFWEFSCNRLRDKNSESCHIQACNTFFSIWQQQQQVTQL